MRSFLGKAFLLFMTLFGLSGAVYGQVTDCTWAGPGCLDTGFGGGWVVTDVPPYKISFIGAIGIQTFGEEQRIVAAGHSYSMWTMARYKTDGTLDKCFGDPVNCAQGIVQLVYSPTVAMVGIADVAVQPDNKLVVVGTIYNKNKAFQFAIARFTAEGFLDQSFGTNGMVLVPFGKPTSESLGKGVALQTDGKIIASGTYLGNLGVVRLNPNGTLDISFATNGMFASSSAYSCSGDDVGLQNVGGEQRIVVVGSVRPPAPKTPPRQPPPPNPPRNCVLRLTADGALDTSFGSGGMTKTEFFGSEQAPYGGRFIRVAIDTDGRILAVGQALVASSYTLGIQMALARFDLNGSLDPSFNGTGKLTRAVRGTRTVGNASAIQSDGRILVVGETELVAGGSGEAVVIWRFNVDGTTDTSFGMSGLVDSIVNGAGGVGCGLALQTNGTFYVAGDAPLNGMGKFALARFYQ